MGNYVGIDPSTKTGLVVLDKNGNVIYTDEITTHVKEEPQRFMSITDQVCNYVDQGDKVFIEGFSYGSKGAGVSTQYGIGWAIRMRLVELETMSCIYGYKDISPGALKKFASGKGNTKKDELVLPIYKKWGFESHSDNIRDAYVLAQIGRYLDGLETPLKYEEEVLKKIGS